MDVVFVINICFQVQISILQQKEDSFSTQLAQRAYHSTNPGKYLFGHSLSKRIFW